ncbi:formate dehydrogenase accessory sulfurtransferase FdhD [Enterovibrio norvegicus]|uniref:FdhD protein n=1 Tax=Enterovibrio norvegicus DSM 15893 TaxID=1121869 RepID=A0A1I5RK38_9GAMM|nr:formate dehydrogenase accessory sulfurtransferase FdhD [Enterovibrio norvegicus]PMH72599.1 formate dehydrogenase family accessory protein FdhD [Enterovibrio norvegicus]PMI30128.1 formate dehydrogenase family accessory protein FdhD [Enterovibrio norvegicus]TKF18524.1 formate dehydrogenase accessory sulfurtransferase FdhD [Enterovibrio norvegicus]SFP58929.1 FdhD protein [Enterovibrio norvegicus DSM 15893]
MTQPNIIKTQSDIPQTIDVTVFDEYGEPMTKQIACERALTVYLNWREIVTLMTLGARPDMLVLGYLRNQDLLHDVNALDSVIIDWATQSAAVVTHEQNDDIEETLSKKTVTSGCGQGTMFGNVMKKLDDLVLPTPQLKQSTLYGLLESLTHHNDTYKAAGAVHGCAVCKDTDILSFVEDIGRHNAVDTLTGEMWLQGQTGGDKIFYTTGRLTSEMVIKVAQMGIPVLLSRSGVTQMGFDLAKQLGITMIARAKGHRFQVFNGAENIDFDVKGSRDE